jgi:hypothetical protein
LIYRAAQMQRATRPPRASTTWHSGATPASSKWFGGALILALVAVVSTALANAAI